MIGSLRGNLIDKRPNQILLEVGGVGDATLLKIEQGDFTVTDVDGRTRKADQRLVAVGVVRAGSFLNIAPLAAS